MLALSPKSVKEQLLDSPPLLPGRAAFEAHADLSPSAPYFPVSFLVSRSRNKNRNNTIMQFTALLLLTVYIHTSHYQYIYRGDFMTFWNFIPDAPLADPGHTPEDFLQACS
jgi:hypothetical protein